jgi:cytochrome b
MADSRSGLRVWDPVVRVGHWALVASIVLAWLTRKGGGAWHEWIGYASLALVALRITWGWVGSRYARFSQFVRSPSDTWRYAGAVLRAGAPRYIGHNPLGAWMIVALLANIALVGFTGWLYTTNAYWGEKWLEDLHNSLANSLLVLVAGHVAGVVVTSFVHRENLVAAMIHGRKRPPDRGDAA